MIHIVRVVKHRTLLFIGTVKGLDSEGHAVKNVLSDHIDIQALFLGISPEELEGLKNYINSPFKVDLSDYEILYGLKLKHFGKVKMPVPAYVEAYTFAESRGTPVYPIDMNDTKFGEVFTQTVSAWDLLRHSHRKSKVWNKTYDLSSPENFALSWDKEMTKIKGYKKLELLREKHFAYKIKELLNSYNYTKVAVVMEIERLNGTLANI